MTESITRVLKFTCDGVGFRRSGELVGRLSRVHSHREDEGGHCAEPAPRRGRANLVSRRARTRRNAAAVARCMPLQQLSLRS